MGFPIDKAEFEKIEKRLGRLLNDEGGKLSAYQEISESDLKDLRLLVKGSTIDATNYLLYCLGGKGGLANAVSYIGRVVKGDMSTQEWVRNFYIER